MATFPLHISYTDFEPSEALNETIEKKADKLTKYSDRITNCEVIVSAPHKHKKQKIYHIQIRLHVPGAELIVNREPEKDYSHNDIKVAVRDAFDAMARQLEDFVQKKRDTVRT